MLVSILNNNRCYAANVVDRTLEYKCPECSTLVTPKLGNINIHHFAHKSNTCGFGTGESLEHEKIKKQIFDTLNKAGHYADMEVHINEHGVNRRADVLANINGKVVAFEIQCSTIQAHEIENRTNDYTKCSIYTVWIYGGQSFNTDMVSYIKRIHYGKLFTSTSQHLGKLRPAQLTRATTWVEATDFGGGYYKTLKKRKDVSFLRNIDPWGLQFTRNTRTGQLVGSMPYKAKTWK